MMSLNLFEYQSLKPQKIIRRKELKPIYNLKEIFRDAMNTIEGKVLNDNILNELQNYNPKLIEDKVKQQINKKKDKLKNKLKELLN